MYGNSWRSYWRQFFSGHTLIALAMEPIFNGEFDKKMTVWDEMFIPLRLSDSLNEMHFVANRRDIVEFPYTGYSRFDFKCFVWLFLGVPLGVYCTLGRLAPFKRIGSKILAFSVGVWSLIGSIYGLLIPLNMLLSDRSYIQGGMNLWIFWPLDLIFLLLAISIFKGRWPHGDSLLGRMVLGLCLGHIGGYIVYVVAWITSWTNQDVSSEVSSIVPLGIAVIGLVFANLRPAIGINGQIVYFE